MPVPPGYEVTSRPATGIITGGLVGLGASYAGAIIVGATQGFKNATGWLAVPIAGPWVAIAEREYEPRRCVRQAVAQVQFITFVAVDGVFQLASGFLLLAGLLSTKQELTRQDLVPQVSLTLPLPGREQWGLSVQGNF
jgi:hypothetical protein